MRAKTGMDLAAAIAVVATVCLDRITKHIAVATLAGTPPRSFLGGAVRIAYVENTGGFLGLGSNLPPDVRTALFSVATGLVLVWLAYVAIQNRHNGWPFLGLTLFIAGGASNWIDRLGRGSVVDFMNLGIGPVRTGVFNVADVAVTLGVAVIVLSQMRKRGGPSPADRDKPADS